jgi:hypothetical protein
LAIARTIASTGYACCFSEALPISRTPGKSSSTVFCFLFSFLLKELCKMLLNSIERKFQGSRIQRLIFVTHDRFYLNSRRFSYFAALSFTKGFSDNAITNDEAHGSSKFGGGQLFPHFKDQFQRSI